MRIAFFGGSFDPPHRGHIAIARAAVKRLSLDRVLVAPVAVQPLKDAAGRDAAGGAGFADRLEMVKLAVLGDPHLLPSDADAPRADGRPNYTFDTLLPIKESLSPGDTLFCLTGADAFLSVRHWHRAAELLLLCDFIVASRPGFSLAEVLKALPKGIAAHPAESCAEWTRLQLTRTDPAAHPGDSSIFLLPDLEEDISATEIRAALANGGETTQTILDPRVAAYIRAHGLYCRAH